MGLLSTRWEAEHAGHSVVVSRSEITRGFSLYWDGVQIAHQSWSWAGVGSLSGTATLDGAPVAVRMTIDWGFIVAGKCTITVGDCELTTVQKTG